MTKHEKVTNELLHLIAQHPDREIIIRVPSEGIVCGDEFSWWSAQFSEVYLDSLCEVDEVLYLKSKSMDQLLEKFIEEEEPHVDLDVCDWVVVEERAESRLSSICWAPVISVEIEAWTGALEMAEKALNDQFLRPCHYCDDNFEFWQNEIGWTFGKGVKVKYCPMCGRKLERE